MITITIDQLNKKAKERPDGYIADVLSVAKREGNIIHLTEDDWNNLRKKYYIQPLIPEKIENLRISKNRFEICKTCEKSLEGGFGCKLYKKCCFGKFRTKPESKCPDNPPKWDIIKV